MAEADPYAAIMARFPSAEDAEDFLARVRWPVVVRCPACGGDRVAWKRERAQPSRYQCTACQRSFSATAGTFLARTHMDLRIWYRLIQEPATTSTAELGRMLDVRRPTIAAMRRRLAAAAGDQVLSDLRRALG